MTATPMSTAATAGFSSHRSLLSLRTAHSQSFLFDGSANLSLPCHRHAPPPFGPHPSRRPRLNDSLRSRYTHRPTHPTAGFGAGAAENYGKECRAACGWTGESESARRETAKTTTSSSSSPQARRRTSRVAGQRLQLKDPRLAVRRLPAARLALRARLPPRRDPLAAVKASRRCLLLPPAPIQRRH